MKTKLQQWWSQRTNSEKLLLILIAIFAIAIILQGEVIWIKVQSSFNYYFSK